MALTVYTNIYSTISQNNLTKANNALSKSIERLSSGLRINHAADDASGLAISEKLRGQIRGMAKASLNAQDAASYLQTAEGGMEVIGDMIQRMRELAVQAGNGVYTTSDRAELQKEVDQLKAEIDRISASTEFNTKKVLTGDAAALWSANTNDINAIVRGAPAEGNYRLDFAVAGGQNSVYKTDVMALNKDVISFSGATGDAFASISIAAGDKSLLVNGGTFSATASAVAAETAAATLGYYDAGGTATALGTIDTATGMVKSGYIIAEAMENVADMSSTAVTTMMKFTFIDGNGKATTKEVEITAGAEDTTVDFGAEIGQIVFTSHDSDDVAAGAREVFIVQTATTAASITFTVPTSAGSTADTTTPSFEADSAVGAQNTATTLLFDDATGKFSTVTVSVVNGANGITQDSEAVIDFYAEGTPATGSTQLKDIARFTNQDGRMILDNTQELTLYGNGGSKVIYMEGSDTIDDFVNKLNDAMNELGMQGNARYRQTTGGSGDDAMPGAIVFESGNLVGSQSDIRFTGDEALINALSISDIQKSEGARLTTTITDAHTGLMIGSDTVTDYMVRGIIQGIDVKVSSNVQNNTSAYLHVVDNRSEAQIGANEGQTFDISIAQMDTRSLEIDDAFVTTFDEAQKAITKFDQALTKVTSARATIGAQINRLEYTMSNLAISSQNLIAAESRIRDLDVAAESATFARNQVLVNAAVAMVAQANALPQTALQLIGR